MRNDIDRLTSAESFVRPLTAEEQKALRTRLPSDDEVVSSVAAPKPRGKKVTATELAQALSAKLIGRAPKQHP